MCTDISTDTTPTMSEVRTDPAAEKRETVNGMTKEVMNRAAIFFTTACPESLSGRTREEVICTA